MSTNSLILTGEQLETNVAFLINRASSPNTFYYSVYDTNNELSFQSRTLPLSTHSRAPYISHNRQVIVASQYGSVFHVSQDGGETWITNNVQNAQYASAYGSDDGKYIMISGFGYAVYSTDYGSNWTNLSSIIPSFSGHSCYVNHDGSLAIAVNLVNGKIYRNNNFLNSGNWVDTGYVTNTNWAGNEGYGDLAGTYDRLGKYIYFSANYQNNITYTTDFGITWTEYTFPPSVYHSTFGQCAYTRYPISNDGQKWSFKIRETTGAQYYNKVYYSNDGMQTVNLVHTGGENHIDIAWGKDYYYILDSNILYRTTDYSSIETIYTFPGNVESILASDDQKHIAVILDNIYVYYSKDYGQSFNSIFTLPTGVSWYTVLIR